MYKPLADSTLLRMPKKEIIELLRTAEHNAKVSQEWEAQQAENLKDWKPVVHGRWADAGFGELPKHAPYGWACSVCGGISFNNEYIYCPHCGAKMDGERKDGGDG